MQTDPIALRNYFAMLDHAADAAPTRDAAFKAGFHPQSTGGNCLVWERKLPCGDNLWLCTEDNGIDGELDDAAWIVGRHSLDCGFVQVYEPLPFNAALELVEQLPTPVRGGEHLQITYETVADFRAGKETR